MAASVRAVTKQIDWSKLTVNLRLSKDTVASLSAFRKRNDEARRVLADLKEQRTDVDFAHFRSVLKNKAIVDEAERAFRNFKPVTYDVATQIKTIEQFETKAVAKAQKTVEKVDAELRDLQVTLTNIETARPVEQLTVDDVLIAKPEITETVDKMVQKGKWTVPGYKEKFGDISYF
ncbi:hypothetical protein BC936DRAFT_140281 [Jimgerdemannia flammicorona]|uniref:ATP synthase subunit d, mitochondrial n=2 Tax=Jimgerdemannia flammicorona TaxID=994334 RepID=A0A433AVN6_9FUNG|nr:hypothetical protein BC936DRAFT_140281 [Jimgerdemannia flammicorona]RUS24434.1 hypothetical protein BC938DRAFT_473586 [Jimgerdemannia flammicorona]